MASRFFSASPFEGRLLRGVRGGRKDTRAREDVSRLSGEN